jgi:hypothetical protein
MGFCPCHTKLPGGTRCKTRPVRQVAQLQPSLAEEEGVLVQKEAAVAPRGVPVLGRRQHELSGASQRHRAGQQRVIVRPAGVHVGRGRAPGQHVLPPESAQRQTAGAMLST